AFEHSVHFTIEPGELAWIFAEQMRREFTQSRAHTLGVSRQIERAEWTNLAVAGQSAVSLHAHNRAIKNGDRFSPAPLVGAFVQRQFNAICNDAGNLHGGKVVEAVLFC